MLRSVESTAYPVLLKEAMHTQTLVLVALLAVPTTLFANAASINVNFTNGTALDTSASLGLTGYEVPGNLWDNVIGNNGTLAIVAGRQSEWKE